MPEGAWQESVTPTPTLLFRYSAVTFNGHRIHYDWPYATETEGYPGLVVHGPLMATLSLRAFCRANPAARLRHFAYRGVRPLIAPHPFEVSGRVVAAGKAELKALLIRVESRRRKWRRASPKWKELSSPRERQAAHSVR